MTEETIASEMQKLVEMGGDKVAIHEPACALWKADHENCRGCPYELGGGKVICIMGMMVSLPNGDPNRIHELMDRTLNSKTMEELQAIPWE